MQFVGVILGFTHACAGLVSVAISLPLIRGQVAPNRWYGIRISAARQSEEAWYRINRHGGKSFRGFGVALIVVGILEALLFPSHPSPRLLIAASLVPLVLFVPTIVHVYRYPRAHPGG